MIKQAQFSMKSLKDSVTRSIPCIFTALKSILRQSKWLLSSWKSRG